VSRTAKKNAWVEIHRTVLEPGKRAPQVPADTQDVPLEMKVKGFLSRDAGVGDEVEITTPTGRRIRGVLTAINPAYSHRFGSPIAELSPIGSELRAILRAKVP
jgi:hypothetical protein